MLIHKVAFGEPGECFRDFRDVEFSRYISGLGAAAHEVGIRAIAQHETEGAEQNRLAGASFTGDRQKAAGKFDGKCSYEREVADVEPGKHS